MIKYNGRFYWKSVSEAVFMIGLVTVLYAVAMHVFTWLIFSAYNLSIQNFLCIGWPDNQMAVWWGVQVFSFLACVILGYYKSEVKRIPGR